MMSITKLEDNFDLSKDQIKKIEIFSSYLDGLPLDYILNESIFMDLNFLLIQECYSSTRNRANHRLYFGFKINEKFKDC